MNIQELKLIIEGDYHIKVNKIEKVKNTYKIYSDKGELGLKVINYTFPHFMFILKAIKHLKKNGFKNIPDIIITKEGKEYIQIKSKYAYLTEWIPSRTSNYDNPLELKKICESVAKLHNCSEGFITNNNIKPRIGWYSWINVFNTRALEILDFKKRINQKAYKSDFDKVYLENIENQISVCQKAVNGIKESNYIKIMDRQVKKLGFCHHDLAHHNILIDNKENLVFIDFDYCILDSNLHDLSSILIRVMKDGRWENKKADLILNSYRNIKDVKDDELKLIKNFMLFPQYFWQIGIQYYWEQQPWKEEDFNIRLVRYLEDVKDRNEFIAQYFI